MTIATTGQLTAPNLTINTATHRFAYRRFGNNDSGALPLVLLQHFRGNLDNWDPALVDALASDREVILFDNAGVGGSSGTVPQTVTEMARTAITFIDALDLPQIDLLGFSLGGFVAQELVLLRPRLVRRLILGGTGPQGGQDTHGFADGPFLAATKDVQGGEDVLELFFTTSAESVAKGWEFVQRIFTRTDERDAPVSLAARDAQMDAVTSWGIPDASLLQRLAGIRQPTLVANGDSDIMVPTPNSYLLADGISNATLKIYPDAGHGFLFQYPAEFAADVRTFLTTGPADISQRPVVSPG